MPKDCCGSHDRVIGRRPLNTRSPAMALGDPIFLKKKKKLTAVRCEYVCGLYLGVSRERKLPGEPRKCPNEHRGGNRIELAR